MKLGGNRTAFMGVGNNVQVAVVKIGDQELLVFEEISRGGDSVVLGPATDKTIDGLIEHLDRFRSMCR